MYMHACRNGWMKKEAQKWNSMTRACSAAPSIQEGGGIAIKIVGQGLVHGG